jgi:membrane protein DedA with SNARE-associated domain
LVVVAAAVGAIVGDNVGYLIGRTVGHRALRRWGKVVGLTDDRQTLGRYLFTRHGAKVVILGRFVAILRTFAAVLAGANQMPWPRFLVSNAAGSVVWACLYGFGAYALGEQVKHIAGPVGIGMAVIAAMVIGAAILYVRQHEHRLIEQVKREMQRGGR